MKLWTAVLMLSLVATPVWAQERHWTRSELLAVGDKAAKLTQEEAEQNWVSVGGLNPRSDGYQQQLAKITRFDTDLASRVRGRLCWVLTYDRLLRPLEEHESMGGGFALYIDYETGELLAKRAYQ